MAQTTYSIEQLPAFEGTLGMSEPHNIVAHRNTTNAVLPFGRVIALGTGDRSTKLPAAANDVIVGISVASNDNDPNILGAAVGDYINVVSKGLVWMRVTTAVTQASVVHVRYAAGSGSLPLGSVGATAVASETGVLEGARFRSSAAANGLALVEINIP